MVKTERRLATAADRCVSPVQAGSTSIVEGEQDAWWLDERTKRLIEETMHLNGALTFTVRPGTPLQLTREQVRDWHSPGLSALYTRETKGAATESFTSRSFVMTSREPVLSGLWRLRHSNARTVIPPAFRKHDPHGVCEDDGIFLRLSTPRS